MKDLKVRPPGYQSQNTRRDAELSPPAPIRTASSANDRQEVQRSGSCACGGGCPRCQQNANHDSLNEAQKHPGNPLDLESRSLFEPRLGKDLTGVRVHTDTEAGEASRQLQARAFTVGQEIFFAPGEYNPASTDGQHLLAHELVHTVQQASGPNQPATKLEISQPGDNAEREADHLADSIVHDSAVVHQPQVSATTHVARQTAGASPAAAPAATPAAAPAQTWEDLLPHVHSSSQKQRDADVAKVVNEPGKAPTFEYNKDKYAVEPMPGDPGPLQRDKDAEEDYRDSGSGGRGSSWAAARAQNQAERDALAAKRSQAVNDIKTARAAIPARDITRSPFSEKKTGNFYDPPIAAGGKDPDKEAVEYNTWMGSAAPTTKFDGKNKDDQKKWAIFQKLFKLEGNVGTLTTSDKTLTFGVGFSSAGTQVEQVIGKFFDAVPAVKQVAFEAGLRVKGKDTLVVVDTDQGWILEGLAAAAYIQTNTALLSLIINASQGVQPDSAKKKPDAAATNTQRQAMVNAQWDTFLDNALSGIPAEILGWPLDSVALAVHSRHAIQNTFPWSFWQTNNDTDLRKMVRAIYFKLRATKQMGWLAAICNGIYKEHADAVKAEEEGKAKAAAPAP